MSTSDEILAFNSYDGHSTRLVNIPVAVVRKEAIQSIVTKQQYNAFIIRRNSSSKLCYDHPHILAGQGSVGMEILEQVPDVDAIIVPVGGGGLIAGISVAAKSVRPNIIIIGVESENCPGFKQAMVAGKPVYTDIAPSCADGLAISMVGVNAFKTSHKLVDKAITLNESYMHRAVLHLLEAEKCVVECSGVTPLAAIMAEMLPDLIGKKMFSNQVVCVLSGGNIDTPMLCRIIQNALALEGRLCRFAVVLTDGPGSIADLCLILKDVGVSIKDITQDRIWVKSSVFQVQVKCVCETNSISQTADLERALKAKYKHVVWAEDAVCQPGRQETASEHNTSNNKEEIYSSLVECEDSFYLYNDNSFTGVYQTSKVTTFFLLLLSNK
ncbi:unnamed protein product [Heterobilharzia americana]|nr:unnamed protein product [Heterobilharzia americana]